MVSNDILKILRDQLPRGSAATIRERLIKKGFTYTLNYINDVLDPDDSRKNEIILDEAIVLRDEILIQKNGLEGRILNPEI
jgi:hypothetical protein